MGREPSTYPEFLAGILMSSRTIRRTIHGLTQIETYISHVSSAASWNAGWGWGVVGSVGEGDGGCELAE